MDFDHAITKTGYGKFHVEIIAACSISVLTVGFQNGLSAYIFPAAQCDLKLNSSHVGLLNVAFLVGGVLSAFLWGVLADNIGRRKVLIITHLLNAGVTVICALNQYIIFLTICRFLNGFLTGGPGSIIFTYLSEFQPPKYRASIVCYCGLFFTSSWLLLPVLAWAILPLNVAYSLSSFFTINSWRLFYIMLEIPEIIAGLWIIKLPESPKYHMVKGEYGKALATLQYMFSRNTGRAIEEFPVKSLLPEVKLETKAKEGVVGRGKTARIIQEVFTGIKTLLRPPLLSLTLLTCVIMFENMLGVFGLGLWLPELFIRFEKFQLAYPNETVSVKRLASLEGKNNTCTASFDSSVILSTVAMGITSIAVSILSGFLATRLPLKVIPFITMTLGGLSSGTIYWLTSSVQNMIVSCIFQSTMLTANMSIGGAVVDLFPTKVNGIAICFVMCAGRIGAIISNVIFGLFIDKFCEIPIFVVTGNVLFGALLCYFIPPSSHSRSKSRINLQNDNKTTNISVIELRNV